EQARMIAHLDECPSCRQRLEALAGPGSISGIATIPLSCLAKPREARLQRVLQAFSADTRASGVQRQQSPTTWIQAYLEPAARQDLLGRLDTYDVTEVLGQGGMGMVFKAFDPALKRWVAIKVLAPHLAGEPVAQQRFAREGQGVAAIQHENVITIHAVSEFKGLPFIVMEYLGGGSLQGYLERHGLLDGLTTARIGVQIASGLAAAHA